MGLHLPEARDESVDVPDGEVRLVVDRAQGSAVRPHEGQYRRIVWRYVGGVHSDAHRRDPEVVPDESQYPQAVLLGRDLGRQCAANERRVQGTLGKPADVTSVIARRHDDRLAQVDEKFCRRRDESVRFPGTAGLPL